MSSLNGRAALARFSYLLIPGVTTCQCHSASLQRISAKNGRELLIAEKENLTLPPITPD